MSPKCKLCRAAWADEAHVGYECPRVQRHPSMAELKDQDVVDRAKRERGGNPALWLRGLCSMKDFAIPPPSDWLRVRAWPDGWWEPAVYFVDGSGGRDSAMPALRRAGCGAVRIAPTEQWHGVLEPRMLAVM